jgi:hypothetical protein
MCQHCAPRWGVLSLLSGQTGTVPVSEVTVGDSLWSRNWPTLNLYRKKKLMRLLVSLFVLSLLFL